MSWVVGACKHQPFVSMCIKTEPMTYLMTRENVLGGWRLDTPLTCLKMYENRAHALHYDLRKSIGWLVLADTAHLSQYVLKQSQYLSL